MFRLRPLSEENMFKGKSWSELTFYFSITSATVKVLQAFPIDYDINEVSGNSINTNDRVLFRPDTVDDDFLDYGDKVVKNRPQELGVYDVGQKRNIISALRGKKRLPGSDDEEEAKQRFSPILSVGKYPALWFNITNEGVGKLLIKNSNYQSRTLLLCKSFPLIYYYFISFWCKPSLDDWLSNQWFVIAQLLIEIKFRISLTSFQTRLATWMGFSIIWRLTWTPWKIKIYCRTRWDCWVKATAATIVFCIQVLILSIRYVVLIQ